MLTWAVPFGPATPSVSSSVPSPTSVVTFPAGSICRTRAPKVSAMNTFPALSTATPYGLLKAATLPGPSAKPLLPEPAKVPTLPARSTLRTSLAMSSGTIEVARSICRQVDEGRRTLALTPRTIDLAELAVAGDGRDVPARVDHADALVAILGNIEVSRRVERHAVRLAQPCGAIAAASSVGVAGHTSPAMVITIPDG